MRSQQLKNAFILGAIAFAASTWANAQQSPAPAPQAAAQTVSGAECLRAHLARRCHSPGASAQSRVASLALDHSAESLRGNHRQSSSESHPRLDAQFFPLFKPNQFNADYIEQSAQFDVGIGYLFERGKKRQHRLQAAKDQTAVTRSQVDDSERQLIFNVGQQFVAFCSRNPPSIWRSKTWRAFSKPWTSATALSSGDMSEGDLLKIKLQLLQFQSDVSAGQTSRKVQASAALRQLLGFESVPDEFDVEGDSDYQPVHADLHVI